MTQPPMPPVTPGPGQPYQPYHLGPIMPARKKRKVWPWLAGGLAAVVLLCCGIGTAVNLGADEDPATVASAAPSDSPSTSSPTPAPVKTTPAPPPPKPKPVSYKALTEREWKLIAKNPDSYAGKTYVVYGVVTQFDSATGDDQFLANAAHKNLAESYEYEINTMFTGSAERLTNLVQDDEFRANVEVVGSFSYDTQIGGNTTVPLLRIASIKVL